MSNLPGGYKFDETRPFYSMVGSFMAAAAALPVLIDPKERAILKPEDAIAFESQLHPRIMVRRLDMAQEIVNGTLTGNQVLSTLCCMLVNTAYEAVKSHNTDSPEWEFFRHIRNAASHNNRFFFKPIEPKRAAAWRGIAIDHNLKGTANPLSGQVCFNTYLWEGDAILLLADLEPTIP